MGRSLGAPGPSCSSVTSAIDVETCPRCGGRLRLLALIIDPSSVAGSLRHQGEPTSRRLALLRERRWSPPVFPEPPTPTPEAK